MCGITGIFNHDYGMNLENMIAILRHRGPDNSGRYIDDTFCTGVNRLSIVDLENGDQPMENERFILSFNGEIYNFKELREGINIKDVKTLSSDTRVLLEYLTQKGVENGVKDLRGMFSFSLYDKLERTLHLVRDSSGIKPLFYYKNGNKVIFGSEIKSILQAGVNTSIDIETLADYFIIGYTLGSSTLFSGIKQVRPGEHIKITRDSFEKRDYFNYLNYNPEIINDSSLAQTLSELIQSSIKEQVDNSRKKLIMLSGGLDSSTLLHTIINISSKENIYLFCFGEQENTFDLVQSNRLANYYGIPLILVTPKSSKDLLQIFPEFVFHQENFNFDCFGIWCLSEEIAKYGKVAYCGQGPDEMFGGYLKYTDSNNYFAKLKKNFDKYVNILGRNFRNYQILKDYIDQSRDVDGLQLQTHFDVRQELPNIQLGDYDKMSMAHSLELRVPYLDERILKFSKTLGPSHKINLNQNKWILREAARILGVPSFVVDKPKSQVSINESNISNLDNYFFEQYKDRIHKHPYHSLFSQSSFLGSKEHLYLAMIDLIEYMFIKNKGMSIPPMEEISFIR